MSSSFLLSAVRTPLASFQGALTAFTSPQLGSVVIREALKRAKLSAEVVQDVIMGCVLPAGVGQAPARQAALGAGLLEAVHALTVNKVCSSGLVSIMLADQFLRLGETDLCIAGGMESMTNAPYFLPKARAGLRLGDAPIIDGMVFDGLRDAFDGKHMGVHAEACAVKYGFTRELQDAFAVESYKRAQRAIAEKTFIEEIVPVELSSKHGVTFFAEDEEPGKVKFDKISSLSPVFDKQGTITAANASSLSDGAACVVVASENAVKKLNVTPIARIVAQASHSQEPKWYSTAPVGAIKNVLQKANLTVADIDYFEINEAFSCVTMAAIKDLGLDPAKVNVNGGAVALGHPIGATGARLVVTLLTTLKKRNARRGLVALCNGGGEATAMIVERV
ncbi:MAG: thiolase family protein [Deltaproteobacteria bacterium]|nr:thiolase family protein [Deltaproteobacteria bacterium]